MDGKILMIECKDCIYVNTICKDKEQKSNDCGKENISSYSSSFGIKNKKEWMESNQ